ncbi:MAG: methyltransferase domain-containing protein [Thermodesulfovibrionales bacterium]|nr:methyltransferase domain-containing protein [Thermodesulfovibrionales bacterium]
MTGITCKRVATVKFWDSYAKWYKLWIEHNDYHDSIIKTLAMMVEPGWKVLDIGAGNGILSLPLCAIGCDVTAVEPSTGMRSLLYECAFSRGIDWLKIDERRWEDIPVFELKGYDLVIACNSLHLTEIGFIRAFEKIFRAGPRHVFLITELSDKIKVKWQYRDYRIAFARFYETDSSFAYHNLDECLEHWTLKKGRPLSQEEFEEITSKLVYEKEHLWLKDKAIVGMYWWRKEVGCKD